MSNTSSSTEPPGFGGSPLGARSLTFQTLNLMLSFIALDAGGFLLLFSDVAWSSGAPANRLIAFSIDSMMEPIWDTGERTTANTCLELCPGAKNSLTRFLQQVNFPLLPMKRGPFHSYFWQPCAKHKRPISRTIAHN